MSLYIVKVQEAAHLDSDPEIYEAEAPDETEACYMARDWYVDDFHAHDLNPDTDLIVTARLRPKE